MKISRITIAFCVVWSGFVLSEPYAELGTAGGISVAKLAPDMKVPDSSKVPIPPPPGAKFISGGGDVDCQIGVRTKLPVREVCEYYKSELLGKGYAQVDSPLHVEGACEIYKGGDMESHTGVMVSEVEDPMFVDNGNTLVMINYLPTSRGNCE